MSTPLPDDFPGFDLEAWVKALPLPEPGSNLDRIMYEVLTTKPLPKPEPPPFVLSPIERRGIRRRKEKP
jgi:hypothetical protein